MKTSTALINAPTLKTTIHCYRFDISSPSDLAAWEGLRADLKKTRRCFNVLADPKGLTDKPIRNLDGQTVELECKHLFEDQWNSAPLPGFENGLRLHDWYEGIYPNAKIKTGYWLELTPEIQAIRRDVLKCGYCGNQEWAKDAPTFCTQCIGAVHLKESDLPLLRLMPVATRFGTKRAPLTEAEAAELIPAFVHAQTVSKETAAGRAREATYVRILKDRDNTVSNANDQYDGLKWILDKGLTLENVIFYNHTGTFCVGWRKPLGEAEAAVWFDLLDGFPFPVEVKRA